jgi:sulfotransferase
MGTSFHFVSGLPRSGSTLLSAILRQNPRFRARMTSPVAALCAAVLPRMSSSEFGVFFDDDRRRDVLRGLFESYYRTTQAAPGTVFFDTNRTWTAQLALLADLYPASRVICCVRDIGQILNSVEGMLQKNPLRLSRIFNFQRGASVYGRAETLMNSETGLIGQPWANLREAWFGPHARRLVVLRYEQFVKEPGRTLDRLYDALGEPRWTHDLERLEYDEPAYDEGIGMPGLHAVRPRVCEETRPPCIPPDLLAKHAGLKFWERPELNARDVTIL